MNIEKILKHARTLSWPHFIAILCFALLVAGIQRVDDWPALWRLLVVDAAFFVTAFLAFVLYQRCLRPRESSSADPRISECECRACKDE